MGMTLILKVLSSALFITLKIMELAVIFPFYSCGNKRRSKTFVDDPEYNFSLDDLHLFFYLSLPVLHST